MEKVNKELLEALKILFEDWITLVDQDRIEGNEDVIRTADTVVKALNNAGHKVNLC